MRKTLLLLFTALFMPVLAMAQTENKALQKTMPSSYYSYKDTRLSIPYSASGYTFGDNGMNGDETYTIGLWYNASAVIDSDTKYGIIMSFGTENHMNANGNWWISLKSDGTLTMLGGNGANNNNASAEIANSALGNCPLDSWHYVTLVVDNSGNKMAFYIDGEQTLEKSLSAPLAYPWSDATFQFGSYGVTMAIDEVHIFNSALTAEEVQKAYYNPGNISSLQSYYTFNEVADGTTSYFNNQCSANNIQAYFHQYTGTGYWSGGLVDTGSGHTIADATPTLVDGREIAASEVTITAMPAEGGTYTISSDGTILKTIDGDEEVFTVNAGTELTFSATPAEGYELIGFFTMNGENPEYISEGKFTPIADTMVGAAFTNEQHTLSITNEQELPYTITLNGEIVNNLTSLLSGAEYQLAITVPEDKVLIGVTLDGSELEATNGVYPIFLNDDAELVINARAKALYTITINQPQGGTVTVSKGTTACNSGDQVYEGTTLTLSATPATGYTFVSYTVNNSEYYNGTLTPTSDVTISATFEEGIDYCEPTVKHGGTTASSSRQNITKITVTDGTNTIDVTPTHSGSNHAIYQDKTDKILTTEPGKTITLTVTGSGDWMQTYIYADWNLDGFSDADKVYSNFVNNNYNNATAGTYTFTIPTDQNSGTYRVRYKLDWDDQGPCAVSQAASIGEYVIDFNILLPKQVLESPRTVTVVSANEALGSVAITAPATTESSVTTDERFVTVNAIPADGAAFINWTDENDVELSTEATYNYEGTSDVTLTANFGYTVTYNTPEGGSLIVKAGEKNIASGTAVAPGTEITVTASPAEGNALYGLTVNGQEVETTDNTYSCTVNEATEITATFGEATYTLTLTVAGNGSVEAWSEIDTDEGTFLPTSSAVQYRDGDFIPGDGNHDLYLLYIPGDNKDNEKETITIIVFSDENGQLEINNSNMDEYVFQSGIEDSTSEYYGMWAQNTTPKGNTNVSVTFTNETSAISDIIFDAENGPVEYYNIQGVRVAAENLTPGFYIARQGSKTKKILIRK